MIADERDEWDAVFAVCWGGVYLGTRTFLPLLLRSDGRPRRQHEQRERVLGVPRRQRPHGVQRGQVRREGLHRGAHRRLPPERAPPEGVGGDAGAHRHLDRVQLRPLLRPRPEEPAGRPGGRAADPLRGPGPRPRGGVRRGRPPDDGGDGRRVPRRCADDGGRGGDDHPRRCPRRRMADPRRRPTRTSSTSSSARRLPTPTSRTSSRGCTNGERSGSSRNPPSPRGR